MGTGSHRPQWEAAKGRPDVLGGIQHARAAKSHTKLKYRAQQDRVIRKGIELQGQNRSPKESPQREPSALVNDDDEIRDGSLDDNADTKAEANDSPDDSESDNDSDDSDDSDLEMKQELARLKQRNLLRAQRTKAQAASKPASRWRSDTPFRKRAKPKAKKDEFLDKYVQ